jgi:hypothetical protein
MGNRPARPARPAHPALEDRGQLPSQRSERQRPAARWAGRDRTRGTVERRQIESDQCTRAAVHRTHERDAWQDAAGEHLSRRARTGPGHLHDRSARLRVRPRPERRSGQGGTGVRGDREGGIRARAGGIAADRREAPGTRQRPEGVVVAQAGGRSAGCGRHENRQTRAR